MFLIEFSPNSRELARNVALDQVAYENKARGLKSLKIQALSRYNGVTIVDGAVKNPNRTRCNIHRNNERIEIFTSSRLTAARKKDCTRSSSI